MMPALSAVAAALCLATGVVHAAVTASFDDLPTPPAVNDVAGLFYANAGNASYKGVVWDSRFRVVGDEVRIDPAGPLFGLPKSPHYFVTNETATVGTTFTNDRLLMTTTRVLTEAWFGQNEYYGYGGGADQVTVHALNGGDILASVSLELPDDAPGQPEPLRRMDTSVFAALSGITGYRIDRRAPQVFSDNWVGDNFVFQSPVPESSALSLFTLGIVSGLAWRARQRVTGTRR